MENKIFLEFARFKDSGEIVFENESCYIKKNIENDNFIKGNILYDCDGNKIGDYCKGDSDYRYDEGASYEFYGKWYASADDLTRKEAWAIIWRANDLDSDCTYVQWAKEALDLEDDD